MGSIEFISSSNHLPNTVLYNMKSHQSLKLRRKLKLLILLVTTVVEMMQTFMKMRISTNYSIQMKTKRLLVIGIHFSA